MNENSSGPLCEKCKSRSGQTYSFYYGNIIDVSRTQLTYNSKEVKTTYRVAGNRDVVLCKRCVTTDWKSRWGKPLKIVLVAGGIFAFVLLGLRTAEGGFVDSLGPTFGGLLLISGATSIFTLVYVFTILLENNQSRGEMTAISLEKEKLGYEAFWNQKDYRKLINKHNGSPTVTFKRSSKKTTTTT
jgi:hypothetical protein